MVSSKMLRIKEIPAEVVANNMDLLTEILLRLPTKPLLKFKCVSKQWLSLISNPKFCLSHTRHHHTPNLNPTALFLHRYFTSTLQLRIVPLKHDDTVCKVPFWDSLDDPRVSINVSCNGLVVYSIFLSKYRFFICNPTTMQFKQLSFPSEAFKDTVFDLNLAFDPLKSPHYKVISIRKVSGYKDRFLIDTYSSETESWTLLGINLTRPNGIEFHNAVFCNGAIHWSSDDVNSLYFDVDNECLKTMPMPKLREHLNYRKVRYFGESGGHLHLVVTYSLTTLKFDVLEMAEDYSQWFVKYHVDLDAKRIAMPWLIRYHEAIYYQFSLLGVIRAEKEEESLVVLLVDGIAFSYNLYNGTSKKLCNLEPKPESWVSEFCYHQFFETLCGV